MGSRSFSFCCPCLGDKAGYITFLHHHLLGLNSQPPTSSIRLTDVFIHQATYFRDVTSYNRHRKKSEHYNSLNTMKITINRQIIVRTNERMVIIILHVNNPHETHNLYVLYTIFLVVFVSKPVDTRIFTARRDIF